MTYLRNVAHTNFKSHINVIFFFQECRRSAETWKDPFSRNTDLGFQKHAPACCLKSYRDFPYLQPIILSSARHHLPPQRCTHQFQFPYQRKIAFCQKGRRSAEIWKDPFSRNTIWDFSLLAIGLRRDGTILGFSAL